MNCRMQIITICLSGMSVATGCMKVHRIQAVLQNRAAFDIKKYWGVRLSRGEKGFVIEKDKSGRIKLWHFKGGRFKPFAELTAPAEWQRRLKSTPFCYGDLRERNCNTAVYNAGSEVAVALTRFREVVGLPPRCRYLGNKFKKMYHIIYILSSKGKLLRKMTVPSRRLPAYKVISRELREGFQKIDSLMHIYKAQGRWYAVVKRAMAYKKDSLAVKAQVIDVVDLASRRVSTLETIGGRWTSTDTQLWFVRMKDDNLLIRRWSADGHRRLASLTIPAKGRRLSDIARVPGGDFLVLTRDGSTSYIGTLDARGSWRVAPQATARFSSIIGTIFGGFGLYRYPKFQYVDPLKGIQGPVFKLIRPAKQHGGAYCTWYVDGTASQPRAFLRCNSSRPPSFRLDLYGFGLPRH